MAATMPATLSLSPLHSLSIKRMLPSSNLIFSLKTSLRTSIKTHAGQLFDEIPHQPLSSPVVNRYVTDNAESWFMYYQSSASVNLALSNNGFHWEPVGPVMGPATDWWAFDTLSVAPSSVLVMSSDTVRGAVYYLYYTGLSRADDAVAPLAGLALSQDGRNWARIEGDHHSNALFEDGATPKVVYHARGDLRMYYNTEDGIAIARSRDGMKWVELGNVLEAGPVGGFDECGVRNGHVVEMGNGEGYIMAYDGVSVEGISSIGLAVSTDGLKDWRRYGDEAVFTAVVEEEDGWDSGGVDMPCLVRMDGDEWRLYYRGVGKDGRTRIGLALSKGSKRPTRFERWTGFRI